MKKIEIIIIVAVLLLVAFCFGCKEKETSNGDTWESAYKSISAMEQADDDDPVSYIDIVIEESEGIEFINCTFEESEPIYLWIVTITQESDYLINHWDKEIKASNEAEAFEAAITEIKNESLYFIDRPFKKCQALKVNRFKN